MAKIILVPVIIMIVAGVWLVSDYYNYISRTIPVPGDGLVFEIKSGTGLRQIAGSLQKQSVLEKPRYFIWMTRLAGHAHHIKAGEYRLEKDMTPFELLNKMVNGDVIQYSLTIVEGWNFRQMIEAIHNHDAIKHTLKEMDDEQIMVKLGYPGQHPEGRFFPETYSFPRGLTDVEFLKRAYLVMQEYLAKEWQHRDPDLPLKNPYEALILASIIEKETAVEAERRQISGVFIRRLKKGMLLQTDPTVIYGMGEKYDGNIRRKDLRTDTPYNTYTRKGLTPTPIAMPGADSIYAALHPEPGKTLYFVATGNGKHHFSSTLEEHNQAVIKYQLKGKPREFSSMKNGEDK